MYKMMSTLWQRIQGIARDSSGATIVEYAVLLALVILVCFSAVHALGGWNSAIFAYLAGKVAA